MSANAASRGARRIARPGLAALALAAVLCWLSPALARASGLEMRAWGANGFGQLGIGTNTGPETCVLGEPCSTKALTVPSMGAATQLAAGDFHTLALMSDGTVRAWGYNGSGQLGRPTPVETASPLEVPGLSGVVQVAAGHEFSLALLANGTVLAWGENNFGQLGNGTSTPSSTPTPVSGLGSVIAIAAGANHALALLSNGHVMAWGNGGQGQLGNGQSLSSSVPVQVSQIANATAVAAGENHSLARLATGKVSAWGEDEKGQLGNGRTANAAEPVTVSSITTATAIAAGGYHSMALLSGGTVMAWGENTQGELGNNSTLNALTPVAVSGLSGVSAIACGSFHSLAATASGIAYAWGYGGFGQLGTGKTETSLVPVQIPGLGSVSLIDGGRDDTLAVEQSGPAVSSLSPSSGPPAGGTTVTISGVNLAEAKQVSFGATPAKSFTVNSSTSISAVSPAGSGTVDVTVTTPAGTSAVNPKDLFTYATAPVPSVTAISPTQGPEAGGTEVKITGTGFSEASAVHFGAVSSPSFKVNSASSITASAPAGSATVDITVTTAAGTSAPVAADRYTYKAITGGEPTVTKVGPNKGPAAGGKTVTIKGTNLKGATGVTFGGVPAPSFTVKSASKLTAVTPPGATGRVDVQVTTATGTSEVSASDGYTYGAPTVTSLSPAQGPVPGGTAVTVTGSGFALGAATIFKFGKAVASSVQCTSSTACTLVSPAAAKAETVDVRATSGGLTSALNAPADSFRFE